MRYWVGVAAANHVDTGKRGSFIMFSHGKHSAVKRLSPGDAFVYYAPMEGIKSGATVRSFVGIGTVDPGEARPNEMMGETIMGQEAWCRSASYLDAKRADIYPLLDELSFIKGPTHWGMAFRRSLFEVGQEDFLKIASAMGVGENFETE